MKVEFDIIDNHALSFEGHHIDLHNNFDFVGYDYNKAERQIKMNWKKSSGDWVRKYEFSSLILKHSAVTFLKVIDQDQIGNGEESGCLGEISFFPSSEREVNDQLLPQSRPNEGDDIIYFFESGQCIRIHCEKIELIIYKD